MDAGSFFVINDGEIRVKITIAPDAGYGPREVSVTDKGGVTVRLQNGFTVLQ